MSGRRDWGPPSHGSAAIYIVALIGLVVLITALLAVLAAVNLVLDNRDQVMVKEYLHETTREGSQVEKRESARPSSPNGLDSSGPSGPGGFV